MLFYPSVVMYSFVFILYTVKKKKIGHSDLRLRPGNWKVEYKG